MATKKARQSTARPPSSYSPINPSDPTTNGLTVKGGPPSIRSRTSSSALSFKSSKGFKRVFGGLLSKGSSNSDLAVKNSAGGDSGQIDGMPNGTPIDSPTYHSANERGNEGGGGGRGGLLSYRSRNARSMDALKLFNKGNSKSSPMSINDSKSTYLQPNNGARLTAPIPSPTIQIQRRSPASGETGKPYPKVQIDMDAPILQHMNADMEEEEEGGNGSRNSSSGGSSLGDQTRRSLDSRLALATVRTEVGSAPSTIRQLSSQRVVSGPGEKTPSSLKVEPSTVNVPKEPQHLAVTPTPTSVTFPQSRSSGAVDPATLPTTPSKLVRPQKPNLSIPIPPLSSKIMSAHTRAVTTMHLSSSPTSSTPNETQSPLSPSHSRSLTTPRLPPSPGHSLRLTPSIVMSRPAWPLPPLPPMPHPTSATSTTPSSPAFASDTATSSFASDTAAAAAAGAVVGGNDKGKGTRGRGGSLFRISPPMRSMTGPTIPSPSSAATETDDSDFRARRSASVNLDLMPSLSVMGETEQDDPDDDELGNDDEDEDEESDEVAREEMEIIGRPSIDSVLSMDSIASTDTVRAPPPPPTTTRVDVSAPSPSTPTNTSGSSHPLPTIDIKGKGKAKATSSSAEAGEEEGEGEGGEGKGSGSDSDDSLYFDARDSILLSSKEAAKVFERRQSQRRSQIYAQNPALAAALLDAGRERERERRLSTWSVSTASGGVGGGRESVYLTPMEGTSAFMTPTPAGYPSFLETVRNDPQFAHQVNAALLSGAGDKRSSVPAGFGLPSGSLVTGGGLSGNGGLNARRGGENRFSMSRLSQGGRAVDLSTLKFDPNSFGSRTPSLSGSTRRRVSSGGPSSGSALPDGLPPSRREGLPNFDSAKPYTTTTTTTTVEPEKAKTRESSMEEDPRTPHASDYFGTRARYSVHAASPSNHRRRGSVTASVSVPAAITEGVLPAADDDATSAAPDAGMKNAPVGSPSTTSQQKTPISAISSPMTPVMGTIKGTKRPSVYRQASRSMVDLSTSSVGMGSGDEDDESNQKINPNLITDLSALAPPLTATPAVDNMAWLVPPPSPMVIRPSMAKRQSTIRRALSFPSLQSAEMPSVANEPPPPTYESIPRREEEGKEVLPRYSNDIILAALVPRKVEFDRPGVQARDRRWNKVWCVLHGTMFKIYKVGTLEVKFGVLSTAPVAGALPPTSASTILSSGRTRQPTPSVSGRNPSLTTTGPAPTISEATESSTPSWKAPLNDTSQHAVLTRNQPGSSTLAPPFAGIPSSPTPSATSGATRSSGSSHMTSRTSYYSRPTTPMTSIAAGLTQSHLSLANTCPQPQATGHGPNGRSLIDNGGTEIYSPSQNALLRQYTLQNAESGLATDYVKRRNVIRVRLEGEQFLMQLAGVEEVVSWIEGFQAASNVALDLDERPMPRGPIYPRRRRRRRVRVPGELPTQSPLSPTNVVVNNAITTSSRSNS